MQEEVERYENQRRRMEQEAYEAERKVVHGLSLLNILQSIHHHENAYGITQYIEHYT